MATLASLERWIAHCYVSFQHAIGDFFSDRLFGSSQPSSGLAQYIVLLMLGGPLMYKSAANDHAGVLKNTYGHARCLKQPGRE